MNTEKMLASRAATRARRAQQTLKVRELKIVTSSLSSKQKKQIEQTFIEAKWLYNSILSVGVFDYKISAHGVHVKLPNGNLEPRRLTSLPAHVKQTIQEQLQANVKSLATAKARGRLVGALKYKSRIDALEYKTGDIRINGNKVLLPKVGWVRVRGTHQLGEEIANARLVRRPGGYYLMVTSLSQKEPEKSPNLDPIGLDFGIKTHVTLSDGREWNLSVEEPERLKRLQRKLQRQVKGSKNREKTLASLRRSYERLSNQKTEAANQLVASLKNHSQVVYQDEALAQWKRRPGYGRVIQHSAMGRVKASLSRLPQAVMLDRWAPTTQLCPKCGSLNKLSLSVRVYVCECGYSDRRDVHAARNMLVLSQLSEAAETPVERGGAPVDWKTTVARIANHKSSRVEAGNTIIIGQSESTSSEAAAETRLSSAVA